MKRSTITNAVRVTMVAGIFAAGYLCGSLSQQNAHAGIGSDIMQRASESGGMIGSVAKLGTTISDLEQHVNGMQKNIETLKAVKSALGGSK